MYIDQIMEYLQKDEELTYEDIMKSATGPGWSVSGWTVAEYKEALRRADPEELARREREDPKGLKTELCIVELYEATKAQEMFRVWARTEEGKKMYRDELDPFKREAIMTTRLLQFNQVVSQEFAYN